MKKSKCKIFILFLAISLIIGLTACSSGGKDAVEGTWVGEDVDYGTVTWKFDGKGGCKFEHEFTDQKGTYEITEDNLTVLLELWEDSHVFNYTLGDGTLVLEDLSPYAPSYDLKKK